MTSQQNTLSATPGLTGKIAIPKKHNINWHEAASCAIQIELQEYAHLLEFLSEYTLGKNHYRIDLLIIKKLHKKAIPKNIAQIFRTYNIFEIKGNGTSINTDAYYKTIGYAGLLIHQTGRKNQYTALDISLTFLCFHYPGKLIKHLQNERKLTVEKNAPGYIISLMRYLMHRLSLLKNCRQMKIYTCTV